MIENWILDVTTSSDKNLKSKLLSKLSHILTVYWQNIHSDFSESSLISINPPSIFIINICLKLEKAEKLRQKRKYNLTSNESLEFGQSL
ncbi:2780_t:CDS:1, partial [Funneliformis geosporum]